MNLKFGIYVLIFISVIVAMGGCTRTAPNEPIAESELPITISLAPAIAMDFMVSQVRATITSGNFVDSMNLAIADSVASGTFEDLEPGFYNVSIQVFDENGEIIASGNGSGEVIAGETTTVYITLQFIDSSGNLEIIVEWEDQPYQPPQSILFVGNSYTASYGGMGELLSDFTREAFGEPVLDAESVTFGGYTFQMHWSNSFTREAIATGDWDLVVLQEQSTRPVEEPDLMYQYADSLCNFIRENGSEPAFFMTWAREYDPEMIEPLAAAYNYCGEANEANVISCGRAFQRCREEYPEIGLYSSDGSHPNQQGSYLAMCLFFSELWQESPVGVDWVIDEVITDEERVNLQNCAWETSLAY